MTAVDSGTQNTRILPVTGLRAQRVALNLALIGLAVIFPALIWAQVYPPPGSYLSAEEIARHYREYEGRILLGTMVAMVSTGFIACLFGVVIGQLRRIEGVGRGLTYTMVICGGAIMTDLWASMMIIAVAAYRPDRAPEITQALHDLGFLFFLVPLAPFLTMQLMMAILIFSDRGDPPVYPRWVGYFTLLVCTSYAEPLLIVFFKEDGFAQRGFFALWWPAVFYGLWLLVMIVMTRKAIDHDPALTGVDTS
jgi:hypothetical protein